MMCQRVRDSSPVEFNESQECADACSIELSRILNLPEARLFSLATSLRLDRLGLNFLRPDFQTLLISHSIFQTRYSTLELSANSGA